MRVQLKALFALTLLAIALSQPAVGQPSPASAAGVSELPLFVIEVKTGPKWDISKPPQEQAFFREHSANLRRLREAGSLIAGARYSDKGLVVVAAATLAEARAMMDADP